jgi:hypothetical protein
MTNYLPVFLHKPVALAGLAIVLSATQLPATVFWNESINGDLSDNQAAPNVFALTNGVNSVIGTVGGGNNQDWLSLTVPPGFQLNSLVLFSYTSTDGQGFTGLQSGTAFVGSVNSPASYLGYAHFGTAASNGADLPANIVGLNILPAMGNNGPGHVSAGAQGFTAPLGSGTYTFLIQQLGSSTGYQFDYGVTPVPEPSALAMLGCGLFFLARRKLFRRA